MLHLRGRSGIEHGAWQPCLGTCCAPHLRGLAHGTPVGKKALSSTNLDRRRAPHLVHVVRARARVVTQPDAKVLRTKRAFLRNHIHAHDLTVGFFNLFELPAQRHKTLAPEQAKATTNQVHLKKYQNRLLATTSFLAKIRMRYSFGFGSCSVGRWRPRTWYSCKTISEYM